MRRAIGLGWIAALVWGIIAPGHAATPSAATLASPEQVVTWSGAATGGPPLAPVVYTPETCAAAANAELCDAFELTIDLPAGTFTKPRDGVLVSIRWGTDFLQWNMFVYGPDGSPVASATDVASNAQALLLTHPANGRYTVVAAPASAEPMTYTGEARVLLDAASRMHPDTVLAPRLWTVPPHDFHVACSAPDPTSTPTNGACADVPPVPSNPTGWRLGGGWTTSCYADEGVARTCLRFSNNIRNAGAGPLILRASLVDGIASGCRMQQVVLRADGREDVRDGGPCEFHAAHGHFHFLNTSQYSLLPAPDDTTTSPNLAATPVAEGRKIGYCLIDVDLWAPLAPRRWSFPTCDLPDDAASQRHGTPTQEMGVSPGWGDVYTWDLPGQYLDITDVADGVYDVVSIVNPDCTLLEAAPGMEGSATRIRLQGGTVTVLAEFGPFGVPGCAVPTPAS